VATYDLKPEMSAFEVTAKLVAAIRSRSYDTLICNYANADMVGHTGVFTAAVRAIEAVDQCLGDIVAACRETGTDLLITADHGNAEQMRQPGELPGATQPHTAHTNNLVPLLYVGRPVRLARAEGSLIDLAPTMLHLLGLDIPAEMTGQPIFRLLAANQITAAAGTAAVG
ncbi:MAG: alkaline phosphatase family protein, partial [Gammaproteobacteria bacterium]|nr:alkaline phosphatase family protein [Gammaproteobacteria bacterium]